MASKNNKHPLYAVIMAGGSGTRFWPLSRRKRPKQLQRVASDATMIQLTVRRILPLIPHERILVVCGADQAREVARQLPELPAWNLIVEPAPRNTAPCVALAALHIRKRDPGAVLVVLPADHHITPEGTFRSALKVAARRAVKGGLCTLGIRPTRPETGYGYVELVKKPPAKQEPVPVKRFVEKPDLATAKRYLKGGKHLWNAGIFIFTAERILAEMKSHMPEMIEILEPVDKAIGGTKKGYEAVLNKTFVRIKPESIDYGVMEKAGQIYTVPATFHWSDVGSFAAVHEVRKADKQGNVADGDTAMFDVNDCVVLSRGSRLVAAIAVDNLVIVDTKDAVLVCPRDQAQRVKEVVNLLKKGKRKELL